MKNSRLDVVGIPVNFGVGKITLEVVPVIPEKPMKPKKLGPGCFKLKKKT